MKLFQKLMQGKQLYLAVIAVASEIVVANGGIVPEKYVPILMFAIMVAYLVLAFGATREDAMAVVNSPKVRDEADDLLPLLLQLATARTDEERNAVIDQLKKEGLELAEAIGEVTVKELEQKFDEGGDGAGTNMSLTLQPAALDAHAVDLKLSEEESEEYRKHLRDMGVVLWSDLNEFLEAKRGEG